MPTVVTEQYTFSVGEVDLSAFCDCGDPCPDCCGVALCGCSNVPTTLHATVTSHDTDCTCLAGQVWTLTYDSGSQTWIGSLDIGGICQHGSGQLLMNLKLLCSGGMVWELQATSTCLPGGSATTTPSSTSCSPFQIVFSSVGVTGCCNGPSGSVVWTITP